MQILVVEARFARSRIRDAVKMREKLIRERREASGERPGRGTRQGRGPGAEGVGRTAVRCARHDAAGDT